MEPMTLGSPVGSPVTSQMTLYTGNNLHGTINTPTSTYYPSYLMGETQSSRVPAGSISPGRPSRQFSTPINANISSPNSPQIGLSRDTFFPNTRLGGDRPGGPPTLSLMGGLPQSPSSRIQSTSFVEHQKIISSPYHASQPLCYNNPLPSSHPSMQTGTPFASVSESILTNSVVQIEQHLREPLEDSWVTVFGFPVASASYILTQFAQLGTIVDQRLPGIGNWMHLKYQTKLQARKALTKHSKIFNGNIMIGVVPCTDSAICVDKENVSLNVSSVMSPRDPKLCLTPQTPKSHIRPLTQAYQASRADIEITPTPNTPKKNDSFVAKAMQHILGI